VFAAALMIFVLAISEFGVPGLLRVRVYTTEVFTAFAALYDFGGAIVLALPLLLLSSTVAVVAIRLTGDRTIVTRRATAGSLPPTFEAWKPAFVLAGAVVTVLSLVLPLTALVVVAVGDRSWSQTFDGSGVAIRNSLVLATIGATLTVVTAVWLAYARARSPRRAGLGADVVFVLLFAVPSTVVGVGLIGLWNRPGILGVIYGTDAMLLLVCLGRFLPVASLGLAAAIRQVPISHEEAAASAGARWFRTMWRIVLPQVAVAIAAMWVVVFVLAFGELGASILVAPPGESTLPIRIYTLIANAPPAQVAALALLQAAVIIAAPLLLAGIVAGRERR
jgi:iron(III) transport system permease protein